MWKYEPPREQTASRITYSVPLYGKRDVTQVNAYVQVSLDYAQVESLLASLELSAGTTFWVLDGNGQVVLSHGAGDHPDPELDPEDLERPVV